MLFSEPKIPQFERIDLNPAHLCGFQCSSASRKFLNRRTVRAAAERAGVSVLFSEPKIPQSERDGGAVGDTGVSVLFSEPKIPQSLRVPRRIPTSRSFQCSSASRKFLNHQQARGRNEGVRCFSALQRAENSSIRIRAGALTTLLFVSVLFSEPKIPQSRSRRSASSASSFVSVLFSEPKIPQWGLG